MDGPPLLEWGEALKPSILRNVTQGLELYPYNGRVNEVMNFRVA
jgi:hypothetical protein